MLIENTISKLQEMKLTTMVKAVKGTVILYLLNVLQRAIQSYIFSTVMLNV